MYTTIKEFDESWGHEATWTLKMLHVLTDDSLNQTVAEGHRTLGRIAWHLAMTIPEMASKMDIDFGDFDFEQPTPNSAAKIKDTYLELSKTLIDQIKTHWNDEKLTEKIDMYGEVWARNFGLKAMVDHQIHHRGQMTVLMRQAGLKVPSLYGPAKEDWANYGMEPPQV